MNKVIVSNIFLTCFFLYGCDNLNSPRLLSFDPPSLSSCEVASVLVKWDVRIKHPEVTFVSVFVSDGNQENIFAEGIAFGEAKTGRWVKPSLPLFIIKDKNTGKILDKATLDGPSCN
jgi:hypothetical protein